MEIKRIYGLLNQVRTLIEALESWWQRNLKILKNWLKKGQRTIKGRALFRNIYIIHC